MSTTSWRYSNWRCRNSSCERAKSQLTQHKSTNKCASSNDNAQTSPFLRLPGEIRNDIYAYVYETQEVEVHIKSDPNLFQHVIEVRGPTEEKISTPEPMDVYSATPDTAFLPDVPSAYTWRTSHPVYQYPLDAHPQLAIPKFIPPRPPNGLQKMLATTRVCRQMYRDTALFPFRYITFSSEHLRWLTTWCQQRLLDEQRDAIATLKIRFELVVYQTWSLLKEPSIEPLVAKMLVSFPHLERLVLTDCDAWRIWNMPKFTIEQVQEKVRRASGLRKLVVERSEDRMFGGGY